MGGAVRKVPKGTYVYLSYTLVLLNSISKSYNRGFDMAIGRWLMRIVQGVGTLYHTPSHWLPEPKAQCEDRNQAPADCPTRT